MANQSPSQTTNLLFFDTDEQPLVASVISADPSATAYLINCSPGTDSSDCGIYNETVTVGPWAASGSAAATGMGTYDAEMDIPGESWLYSIHCAMTGTIPATCTSINIGGNNDGTPTMTFTSPASDAPVMAWTHLPVTVTAGAEKLQAASSAFPPSTTSAGTTSSTAVAQASGSSSMTSASATASPGSASLSSSAHFGSIGLSMLLLSFVFNR